MRWGEGKGCSGEMWSPLADSPPRSVAPSSISGSHQSDRLGGIWIPTSGISRWQARTRSRMSSSVVGDLSRLGPVVARVGHEVLQDHLLEVAVLAVDLGERLQCGHALLGPLPD